MFGMGWIYFESRYIEGEALDRTLELGVMMERFTLGGQRLLGTGVFSYGDLAANFNGMRFWNHVLQKSDDVLGKGHNAGPYVRCENGKWVLARPIDFRNYVDASMDETQNCRRFASQGGLDKSLEAMRARGYPAVCPLDRALAERAYRKYDVVIPNDPRKTTIASWIFNLGGHGLLEGWSGLEGLKPSSPRE